MRLGRGQRALHNLWAPLHSSLPVVLSLGGASGTASASFGITTGGPVFISGSASSTASGSNLGLSTAVVITSLTSPGTGLGANLDLATSSSSGSKAAPAWLGFFVLDSSGSPIPTISGGANSAGAGSLSLLTPTARPISGSASLRGTTSLILVAAAGSGFLIGNTDGSFLTTDFSGDLVVAQTDGSFSLIVPVPA